MTTDPTLGTQNDPRAFYMKCDDCGGLVNMYDGDTLLHCTGGLCLKPELRAASPANKTEDGA